MGGTAGAPTYFLSLRVENYRAFGPKQTLDLSNGHGRPAPFTVILGDNGSGKTSLLHGLVAMGPRNYWDTQDGKNSPLISANSYLQYPPPATDDVHLGARESQFEAVYGYGALLGERVRRMRAESLTSQTLRRGGAAFNAVRKSGTTNAPIHGMVLLAYGANRPIGSGSLADYHADGTRSLRVENAPLVPAEEWLLQQDLLARHGNGDAKQARARLKTVIELIKHLLPEDDILDVTFKSLDLSPTRQRIAVHIKTPYGELPLRALSLGYRTLTAWMIDLAVQLFARYPDSPQPFHEAAVVLVDEIDLHLHPRWQRKLFAGLAAKFPNVQFIVTAHSPLIVQAAGADANLVVLQRPEGASYVHIVQKPNAIRHWRIDQLLTSDLFGLPSAWPPELDELYLKKEALLRKATLTRAEQAMLDKLNTQLHQVRQPPAPSPASLPSRAAKGAPKRRRKA